LSLPKLIQGLSIPMRFSSHNSLQHNDMLMNYQSSESVIFLTLCSVQLLTVTFAQDWLKQNYSRKGAVSSCAFFAKLAQLLGCVKPSLTPAQAPL